MKSKLSTVICVSAASIGMLTAYGDTVPMAQVGGDLRVQDLSNLAEAVGVRFEIFDYETSEPHCVHFFVDAFGESDFVKRHDGHGLCGLAGPHRLTVQWKAESGKADFRFIRYRRDIEQGGSVSGPAVPIPESTAFSQYGIEPPELDYGKETILVHGTYGPNEGPRTEFKVLAELRENPDNVIGTE